MGASEQKQKNSAMSAMLKATGYPHGRRRTTARPNSGGTTMTPGPGSANFQRRDKARADKAERARERDLRDASENGATLIDALFVVFAVALAIVVLPFLFNWEGALGYGVIAVGALLGFIGVCWGIVVGEDD